MICIPYIINDSYKIARMGAQQEAYPFYIIDTKANKVELFHFEERLFAFDPNDGMGDNGERDYNFEVVKDQCTVSNDLASHTAKVQIAIKKYHPDGTYKPEDCKFRTNDGLSVDKNKVFFNLRNIGHRGNLVSSIIVTLFDVDEDDLEYTFGINATQTENIFDIVIDFGSEASQVWINQRTLEPGHIGNQMPLFANIKRDDGTLEKVDNEKIYQYDLSDPNLFRSLFFIKKDVPGKVIGQSNLKFINNEDDLLTILTNMVALPNLKLMDHNEVYLPNFTINGATTNIYTKSSEIRAEILKFFFQTVLRQVNKLASDRQVACKLTFLVPNTYKQATLSKIYNQLVKDINALFLSAAPATDDAKAAYSQIKPGVEVDTFSESDASFFGSYNATNFVPSQGEQLVLIIDVGKGTSDFSVLCAKGGVGRVEVERYARSGFVGAGNVMTFAILVSVVKQFADTLGTTTVANVYDTIKELAYNKEYFKKNQLYRYLEELKRNQPMEGRTSLSQFISDYSKNTLKSIKGIDIDKWADILKEACGKKCYVNDDDPVVLAYAELMAKRLADELRYVFDESRKINKVIFSGRGAKSKALKDALKNVLQAFLAKDPPLGEDDFFSTLPDSAIKNGCLKGPLNPTLCMDHMNMPIVGWPLQMKFQPLDRKARHQKGQKETSKSRSLFGSIIDIFNGSGDDTAATVIDEEEEVLRAMCDLQRTRKVPSSSSSDMSKIQGLPVNINAEGNRFVLGNHRCLVNIKDHQIGEKRIFFDGEEFVARDEKDWFSFVYEDNTTDDSFITETLFPMTGDSAVKNMTGVTEVLAKVVVENTEDDDDDWVEVQPADNSDYYEADGNADDDTSNNGAIRRADDDDDFAI